MSNETIEDEDEDDQFEEDEYDQFGDYIDKRGKNETEDEEDPRLVDEDSDQAIDTIDGETYLENFNKY
jgi:hypothetical protein